MSFQVTTAFVKQFGANIDFLAQQKGSRLRDAVRLETGVVGEDAYFDQMGATTAQKKTSRHADTPLISTPHSRRRVTLYDHEWADLLDDLDKVKMLTDPTSSYAMNGAWALGRSLDDEIISNALGTAYTGKDGSTTVSLPSAQKVVAASAGLTIAKLRSAREILNGNDVDPDEPRFIALTSKQVTNLLATTEVTSSDYNTVKALVQGQVDTFMGFKFIEINRLTVDGNSDRQVIAWVQSGLLLAIAAEIKAQITQRADKSYAWQAYAAMSIGSTRMEEEKVVEIACVES